MSTKEKIKLQIDEMDDQIGVWEENEGETKAGYKEKLAALKAKRNEIKAKYDELADATEEKWEEAKDVVSSASESFKEGFNKLKSLFD